MVSRPSNRKLTTRKGRVHDYHVMELGNRQEGMVLEYPRPYILIHKQGREGYLGIVWDFETSHLSSSDMSSPTGPHLLIILKQFHKDRVPRI